MEFFTKDLPEVEKEAKSFADCMFMATYHGYQKDYHQVANYLDMASRSARRLGDFKENKKLHDQAASFLEQIEEETIKRLLFHER